jgi:hypothetical protein
MYWNIVDLSSVLTRTHTKYFGFYPVTWNTLGTYTEYLGFYPAGWYRWLLTRNTWDFILLVGIGGYLHGILRILSFWLV